MERHKKIDELKSLLSGKAEHYATSIYIVDPSTGIKTLYGSFPSDMDLNITVMDSETANEIIKLKNNIQ